MRLQPKYIFLTLLMLGLSGVVHGMLTHRWAPASAQETGIDLLSGLNKPISGFMPGSMLPVDPKDMPPKTKTVSRQFLPQGAGRACVAAVTSGVPAEVAIHTPDVCYLGTGYRVKTPTSKQTILLPNGSQASFYVADFEKQSPTGVERIRVRWAWSANGAWEAPDFPRWYFGRSPLLYKLYVVHPLEEEEDLTKNDPYRTFVGGLAQELGQLVK